MVVAALLDSRERVGNSRKVEVPAWVHLYVSLVDARSGERLWGGAFDEEDRPAGWIKRSYGRFVGGQEQHWRNSGEIAGYGVHELVDEMVDELSR